MQNWCRIVFYSCVYFQVVFPTVQCDQCTVLDISVHPL